jgi:carbon storage regulator CsrA
LKSFVQAKNESIVINGEIVVTVLDISEDNVVLAIDAPAWIEVRTQEEAEEGEAVPVRPR